MKKIKNIRDVYKILDNLPSQSRESLSDAKKYQDKLLKPKGSLGILEDISIFFSGWQKTTKPKLDKVQTIIFAGNHGVCKQNVNSYPQSVTSQMVKTFRNGGAAINQLSKEKYIDLSIVPLKLNNPTKDISVEPAMKCNEFILSINKGIEAINPKSNLLVLGEMGIGNTTIASTISAAFFGGDIQKWVGKGTAENNKKRFKKVEVVKRALKVNKGRNPIEILRCLGGREQAAIFGATLAARSLGIPVLIDGFVCTASIIPLYFLKNEALEHCIFGHCSSEKGHKYVLRAIKKKALLNLNMCLGEGSGAMVALNIIRSAIKCNNDMSSFSEAGVSVTV